MYNLLPIFFGVCMLGLGLFMAIDPKNATKKEMREDEKAVAGIRVRGFILIGCGVVLGILGIILARLG